LIENPSLRRDKPAQRKPFQKRLERKPEKSFSLRALPPNPIRRDKPAQRFRRNGFGSAVVLKRAGLWVKEVDFQFAEEGEFRKFQLFSGMALRQFAARIRKNSRWIQKIEVSGPDSFFHRGESGLKGKVI
jgi:hypothetical protein